MRSHEVRKKVRKLISCCSIQLVFSNFYLGIALGALQYASKYTASSTRAWPFGGDVSTVDVYFSFSVSARTL